MTRPGVWAVVVAAGSGSRFGGVKQYEELDGRRVLDWSVAAAAGVAEGVVLVVPPDRVTDAEDGVDAVVAGGETRPSSVRAGLAAVPPSAVVIVVHDAARPLAAPELFDAVVDAVEGGADAAVPGIPLTDTVKRVAGDRVVETVDRTGLVAVQTPQAFRAEVLRAAHAGGGEGTDDASLVERAGGTVVVVAGDVRNIKVTHRDDLRDLRRSVR